MFNQKDYDMKKILYTILSLFILSCSSYNDSSIEITINPNLVGTWIGSILSDNDPTSISVQTIVFNADGTGSISESIISAGETFDAELLWYSDDTTIYGTLLGEQDEIGYILSVDNSILQLTFPEGDVGEYVRLE